MKKLLILLILFCTPILWSQNNQWHVRPYSDNYTNPSGADGTSFATAWCLQYALSGGGGSIQPGDTVWLHGDPKTSYNGTPTEAAIYKGHFKSVLVGSEDDYIRVASFPGEWAVIDGNIHNNVNGINNTETQYPNIGNNSPIFILEVRGGYVHFDDFEITCLGNFSRIKDFRTTLPYPNDHTHCNNYPFPEGVRPPFNFHEYTGIEHNGTSSLPIQNIFSNLVFRNIPGVALGSWKHTLDSEIYGNIFFNNGIIEITGSSCSPLESYVNGNTLISSGNGTNCRGHQTTIYTQNTSEDKSRKIRNNIFLNCYDSGLNIWSASTASSVNYVKNYEVFKNIFINNGNPVPDETANMIISTNAGNSENTSSIKNINVNSNIFYKNTGGVTGIRITCSEDIKIENNFFLGGAIGMDFSGESNHKIKFTNNIHAGRRILVNTSISNFKSINDLSKKWEFDYNTYFTVVGTGTMFKVPTLTNPCNPTEQNNYCFDNLWLVQPNVSNFRTLYDSELHSSRRVFSSAIFPSSRVIIDQNKYQPNKFTVTIYNPSKSSNSFLTSFSDYSIPEGTHYTIRDVQNYFNIIHEGDFTDQSITLPNHNPENIELPLPLNDPNNIYGPRDARNGEIIHSDIDLNTYIIEFDCSNVENLSLNQTNISTHNYVANNTITFESNYIAENTANISAIAGNAIYLKNNTWIKKESHFLGKIGNNTCSIAINEEQANMAYETNPDNEYPPSGISSEDEPPYPESRIKLTTTEGVLTLYPNPTSGLLKVQNGTSKIITRIMVIQIETGKILLDKNYEFQENIIIDISKVVNGFYTAQILFEDGSNQVIKIIKK